MTALEFLQKEKIIKEGFSEFVISFNEDERKIELTKLLESYLELRLNQKNKVLFDLAKEITNKQRLAFLLPKDSVVDWNLLEDEWFDYLESKLGLSPVEAA